MCYLNLYMIRLFYIEIWYSGSGPPEAMPPIHALYNSRDYSIPQNFLQIHFELYFCPVSFS